MVNSNYIFNTLFLVLISVFVPIIVFAGVKIYRAKNLRKLIIGLTITLLVLEILRFFCNAILYKDAVTPKADMKFGITTIMCILALFATFNKSKFSVDVLRPIFVLASLGPVIIGMFNLNSYVNTLDVNGVCKAFYMLECGFILAIALFYVYENNVKIGAWNILWACLSVLAFAGINALTIYYWKINTPFDLDWYMSWLTVLLTVPAIFGLNRWIWNVREKRKNKEQKNLEQEKKAS